MSEEGYIQGAGDDSEGWAQGLTPELFWEHRTMLLHKPGGQHEELVREIMVYHSQSVLLVRPRLIRPTSNLNIAKVSESCNMDKIAPESYDLIINCGKTKHMPGRCIVFDLGCRPGKLGSRDLRNRLESAVQFVSVQLQRDPTQSVLITCETGTDLSVGVALVLLCRLYDDYGRLPNVGNAEICHDPAIASGWKEDIAGQSCQIDKSFVRQRLTWITCSVLGANPSRSTLQAVNSSLMKRPH